MAKKSDTKQIQRLDKVVAHLTGMSRTDVNHLIRDGAVLVNGEAILDGATKVSLEAEIHILGEDEESTEALGAASDAFKKRVFMLNKPVDYVCADRDKHRLVVSALFREEQNIESLHCAGRLDVDTTGLLIVTDDGDLNHQITSPKKEVGKLYLARLDKEVPESAVKSFLRGIKHPEEAKRYKEAKLFIIKKEDHPEALNAVRGEQHWAAVTLTEGRYHQVKRMFEVVGCEVLDLARLAIGSLQLDSSLTLSNYVKLEDEDIAKLFESKDYSYEDVVKLFNEYVDGIKASKMIFAPPTLHYLILGKVGSAGRMAPAAAATAAATAAAAAATSATAAYISESAATETADEASQSSYDVSSADASAEKTHVDGSAASVLDSMESDFDDDFDEIDDEFWMSLIGHH